MGSRFIGLDLGKNNLRVAVLTKEKMQFKVSSLTHREFSSPDELELHLNDLFKGEIAFGDYVATSLSTNNAYIRKLSFPFKSEAKIAAAIPYELSSQLPISIESCEISNQKILVEDMGASVMVAAVPSQAIESVISLFESLNVPLHRIDLSPFCHVASLGEQIGNGILIYSSELELTITLLHEGQVVNYRFLPFIPDSEIETIVSELIREIQILRKGLPSGDFVVNVMGTVKISQIAEQLGQAGINAKILSLALGGEIVDAEFLPAVSLAMRAGASRTDQSFNFRRGRFQLKGEWASFKKRLVLLSLLTLTLVLTVIGFMTLNYIDKSRQASLLQKEMVSIYKEIFPNAATIVDVPLQLKSAINQLELKSNLMANTPFSALSILKEMSKLSQDYDFEIKEYTMAAGELKVAGHTSSFEKVNQLAQNLEQSELFDSVQVSDAQLSLQGNLVDFRMTLSFSDQREAL